MLNPRHRRSPKNLTLNDVYDDWLTGGGVISSLTTAPWYSSVSYTGLDLAYHGTHSGGKFITSLLYNFVDDDGHITVAGYSAIATMLMAKYGVKWTHLWKLYTTQYNPLHAYNMSETEISEDTGTETTEIDREIRRARNQTLTESGSHDSTATRTPNLSEATSSRDVTDATVETTRTPNLSEVTVLDEDIQLTGDETDETTYGHVVTTDDDQTKAATLSVFGFNSSTAVPKESTSGTDTDDTTVTNSGTDVTTKETDSGTERDSTTTKTTTGTDIVTEDTDSTVTGSNTKLTTGTDVVTEDTDSTVTGSNTKLTTGTDSTRDTGTTAGTTQNADSETTGEDRTSELTVDRRNEVTRTRQGNMFKAPAELLSLDRDFWLTEFFDIVFSDIDQLLTLGIYAESSVRYKIY